MTSWVEVARPIKDHMNHSIFSESFYSRLLNVVLARKSIFASSLSLGDCVVETTVENASHSCLPGKPLVPRLSPLRRALPLLSGEATPGYSSLKSHSYCLKIT